MYKKLIQRFSEFGNKYMKSYFQPLKEEILESNINIVYEVYVGKMLFYSVISFLIITVYISLIFLVIGNFPLWFSVSTGLIIGGIMAFLILTLFHTYPFQIINTKKKSIEANLPFAMNHMAAIAASGVPPYVMFRLLTGIHEYGEIANQCAMIIRNIDVFGMDTIVAIKQVADRSPSEWFKQFLYGIISTITSGGDLKRYLSNAARDALFEYRLRRERYLSTLSTYADFYTAVLIAAPLFFISILSVMSMIGGQVFGMSIPDAMQIGVYAFIPLLNIVFILFIHFTQPTI